MNPKKYALQASLLLLFLLPVAFLSHAESVEVTDIGSRRELFLDRVLIETLSGGAAQRMHRPVPREVTIEHDAAWEGTGSGYHSVFKDENPNVAADARYKAIALSTRQKGVWPLKSPDGLRWTPMCAEPMLAGRGAFDSMNLAFWDARVEKYRAYWRIFPEGSTDDARWAPPGVRGIRTATSDDMIHWGPHRNLSYEDSPMEEFYTNQIKPYHRAPHILIGFPTRFLPHRIPSDAMDVMPDAALRALRSSSVSYYGTTLTEGLLMSSRNGTHFNRWNEAFLPPGPERPDTWNYGHQFTAWHVVETASTLPGAANELSLYASEGYWHGAGSTLRRYSLRLDGFVSINAPHGGGELVTKPLIFDGKTLHLNFASSAVGGLWVALQTPDGNTIDGYALTDSNELFGDSVDREVTWNDDGDVSALAGKPIRIRVVMKDVDLYAYWFE